MTEKDYRTWWRKGNMVACELFDVEEDHVCLSKIRIIPEDIYTIDIDSLDCMREQLWAIREGLA